MPDRVVPAVIWFIQVTIVSHRATAKPHRAIICAHRVTLGPHRATILLHRVTAKPLDRRINNCRIHPHLVFVGSEPRTKRVCERSKWLLATHNCLLRSQTRFVRGSDIPNTDSCRFVDPYRVIIFPQRATILTKRVDGIAHPAFGMVH